MHVNPPNSPLSRRSCWTFLVGALFAGAAACAGGGGGDSPKKAPFVAVESTPWDGQTQYPTWFGLVVYFSKNVDPATASDTTVRLLDVAQGGPVGVSIAAGKPPRGAPGKGYVFVTPLAQLQEAADYRLEVTPGLLSKNGEPLEAPVAIAFRTADVARLASPDPQDCSRWGIGVVCGDVDDDGYDDAAVQQQGLLVVFFGPDFSRQVSVTEPGISAGLPGVSILSMGIHATAPIPTIAPAIEWIIRRRSRGARCNGSARGPDST